MRTNPTQITNSGVITQVGGDDGGECVAQSPSINVSDASTLSLAWFHGQRDTGDDAAGDLIEGGLDSVTICPNQP